MTAPVPIRSSHCHQGPSKGSEQALPEWISPRPAPSYRVYGRFKLFTWNTGIRSAPVRREQLYPEEQAFIEPREPDVRRVFESYLEAEKQLSRLVSHDSSPIYRRTRAILDRIVVQAGYHPEDINFDLLRVAQVNASIFRHEQLEKPHIFMTTGLLRALAERYGDLHEGHIAQILGHELGHLKLGHYDPPRRSTTVEQPDLPEMLKVKLYLPGLSVAGIWERGLGLSFGRDQELHCDELGLRWSKALNLPPEEGIDTLRLLAELAQGQREQIEDIKPRTTSKVDHSASGWIFRSITKTHPGSDARVFRGRGVLRQIQIEENLHGLSALLEQQTRRSPVIPAVLTSQDIQPTAVQHRLHAFDQIFCNAPEFDGMPWSAINQALGIEAGQSGEISLEELKHLRLLIPALGRALNGYLPFLPFGYFGERQQDRECPVETGLMTDDAKALGRIDRFLIDQSHCLTNAAKDQARKLGGDLTAAHELRLDFKCWISVGGLYFNPEEDRHFYRSLLPRLAQDPLTAIELIAELGLQHFDLQYFGDSWVAGLSEAKSKIVRDRAAFFETLYLGGQIDLRGALLKNVLNGDLLDGIETEAELVQFVVRAEQLFGRELFWESERLDRVLGQNINLWCEQRIGSVREQESRERFFKLLSDLDSRSRDHGRADIIVVEAARWLMEESTDRQPFGSHLDWITQGLPKGMTRDLTLCLLLEVEAEALKKARRSCEDLSEETNATEIALRTAQVARKESEAGYVAAFEAIAPFLDLTWYQLGIRKGEIPELLPAGEVADLKQDDLPQGSEADPDSKKDQEKEEGEVLLSPENSACISTTLQRFVSSVSHDLKGPFSVAGAIVRACADQYVDIVTAQNSANRGRLPTLPMIRRICRLGLGRLVPDLLALDSETNLEPRRVRAHSRALQSELERAFPDEPLNPVTVALLCRGRGLPSLIDLQKPTQLLGVIDSIPAGEFRDFLILTSLAGDLQVRALMQRLVEVQDRRYAGRNTQLEEIEELTKRLEKLIDQCRTDYPLSTADRKSLPAEDNSLETTQKLLAKLTSIEKEEFPGEALSFSLDRLERLERIATVYNNYYAFLKLRYGLAPLSDLPAISVIPLKAVASEIGRLAFQVFYQGETLARFKQQKPGERLSQTTALFLVASESRDRQLMSILEDQRQSFVDAQSDPDAVYLSPLAQQVYELLYAPHVRYDLGRKIYSLTLQARPEITADFRQHFDQVLATHPEHTVSRERALKTFFDGAPGRRAAVRSWEERDVVLAELGGAQTSPLNQDLLMRSAGILILEDAMNELNISTKSKVDTLLWIVGLKGKSHLVSCYELIEGSKLGEVEQEAEKLSDDEKVFLIKNFLAGPQGVLKSEDQDAKREFLDTLFFSVFGEDRRLNDPNVRYFKAVYDTLLYYIEPERAAHFLGNFLVSHLEGKDFNQQVKIFFGSFGFIGIKFAQYLVSNTTMIPEDMKEVLMDLTSRVEGPDKRFVYEMAERIYGADARCLIKEVGDRVGGGSLMSFYEVVLWNEDRGGAGRRGVVGILRPDIVQALPEDLHIVHRLIETMTEAPEIFGGNTVSMDLMENLMWQSLIETDLQRTARLQNKMRAQISDPTGQKTHCAVPAVWDAQTITTEQGEIKTVELNRGPFIFMDHARGITLDLYMREMRQTGVEGQKKVALVMNKVAEKFLDQLTTHGLVHCDLHPGNILVHEYRDPGTGLTKIEVTLLDVGLSTELSPALCENLGRILRVAVGRSNLSPSGGQLQDALRNLLGVGRVPEARAMLWIGEAVDLFERMLERNWDPHTKARTAKEIWRIIDNPTDGVQTKIAQISSTCNDLGITLPREFYYIMRGVGVMNHVWEYVDWSTQIGRIHKLGAAASSREALAPIDARRIIPRIELVAKRIGWVDIDTSRLKGVIDAANTRQDILERFEVLRDGLQNQYLAQARSVEEAKVLELLRLLCDDQQFRDQMGLAEISEGLRAFLDETAKSRAAALQIQKGTFLAAAPLASREAARNAYRQHFGILPRIWNGVLYPGSLIRVKAARRDAMYVIRLLNDVEMVHYDETSLAPLLEPDLISALIQISQIESRYTAKSVLTQLNPNEDDDDEEAEFRRLLVRDEKQKLVQADHDQVDFEEERRTDRYLNDLLIREEEENVFTELDSIVRRDEDPSYRAYMLLQLVLDRAEKIGDPVKLGALITEHGLASISVLLGARWVQLSQLVVHTGETRMDYQHAMRAEREKLGLDRQN